MPDVRNPDAFWDGTGVPHTFGPGHPGPEYNEVPGQTGPEYQAEVLHDLGQAGVPLDVRGSDGLTVAEYCDLLPDLWNNGNADLPPADMLAEAIVDDLHDLGIW